MALESDGDIGVGTDWHGRARSDNADDGTEVVVLAGGRSSRMGADKASLLVDGTPLIVRSAGALVAAGYRVTVLGRQSVAGVGFLADAEDYAGPAAALSRFEPNAGFVFVMSCDLARFDARLVGVLRDLIGDADAAAPLAGDRAQPLCALYRAQAFEVLRRLVAGGERRVTRWLEALRCRTVSSSELEAAGLDPRCVLGANTPEELAALLAPGLNGSH